MPAGDRVIVGVDYRMVNATSGLDIGVPPFSPARFPEVQEDIHLVGGRVIINATDIVSVNGLFGKVVKGRNTASSNVFGVSLGFAFDSCPIGRSLGVEVFRDHFTPQETT